MRGIVVWLLAAGCGVENPYADGLPQVDDVIDTSRPAPGPAPEPMGLTATGAPIEVSLSWQAVPGPQCYGVYWGLSEGFSADRSPAAVSTTTSLVHRPLEPGTTYWYAVAAMVDGVAGQWSDEVSATPLVLPAPVTPTGLMGTPSMFEINLRWDPVPHAEQYVVGIAASPDMTADYEEAPTFGTSLLVDGFTYFWGISSGTTYYFTVRAENRTGVSAPSMVVAVTTL